jgi:hypothetical protein
MREGCEYVIVPLPKDEDEPDHPELEPPGEPVDLGDPRLMTEDVGVDPEADAFATSVTLKVAMDVRGVYATLTAVKWKVPSHQFC